MKIEVFDKTLDIPNCQEFLGIWNGYNTDLWLLAWINTADEYCGWYVNPDLKYEPEGMKYYGWSMSCGNKPILEYIQSREPGIFNPNKKTQSKNICQCSSYDITWVGHNQDCPERKQ